MKQITTLNKQILELKPSDTHKAAISVCEQLLAYIANNNRYIENRSIKPTDIVGISRGGLFLAQYVAYAFEKKWSKCKVRTYTEILRDKPRFLNKSLIICDDILDSGATLDKVVSDGFCNSLKATLFAKDIRLKDWLKDERFFVSSKHRIISRDVWVKFPWDF